MSTVSFPREMPCHTTKSNATTTTTTTALSVVISTDNFPDQPDALSPEHE